MTIVIGNKVKVEYEGRFPTGEVFDSTEKHGGEPLEFIVGSGMLVSGFEKAVEGMAEGEEKEVILEPKDAYGDVNPQALQKVPKDRFPPEAKEGMMIGIPTPMGQIPATIAKIEDDGVTIDMNHPMAGKTLVFKIKVVSFEEGDFLTEMRKAQEEQMKAMQAMQQGHACGCGDGSCSSEDKDSSCGEGACACH
jgi:FKBP-type peptidyl-prolyl cis-trans isomerase 2